MTTKTYTGRSLDDRGAARGRRFSAELAKGPHAKVIYVRDPGHTKLCGKCGEAHGFDKTVAGRERTLLFESCGQCEKKLSPYALKFYAEVHSFTRT